MRVNRLLWVLLMLTLTSCYDNKVDNLSSAFPSLYITLTDEHLDSVVHNRKYKAPAYAILTSSGDTILQDTLEHVKTRGNSTFHADKKAYSIKLKKKKRILGLDKGKRFALLANAFDESHIRNAVAFDLASEIGLLAPRYSYLSLFINSDYKGLYQITNNVEDNPAFLNKKVILIEKNGVRLDTFHIVLPRHVSAQEKDSIKLLYDCAMRAIKDSTVSMVNLSNSIDLSSFVRYYLLQEITHNMDAGVNSFFLYSLDDSIFYAGPAWDFDLSLCATSWPAYEWTKNEIISSAKIDSAGQCSQSVLLYYLLNNKAFRELVRNTYLDEISGKCHSYLESGRMDSLFEMLESEVEMDRRRNGYKRQNKKHYITALNRVRCFLQQRIEFLDWYYSTQPNEKVCVTYRDTWFGWWERTVEVWLPSNRVISVPELLYDAPFNNSPIPSAIKYAGTDSILSGRDTITSDMNLELKWREPNWWEFQFRRIKKKLRIS